MTDINIVGETHPLIDLAAAELGRYVGLAPAAPEDTPRFHSPTTACPIFTLRAMWSQLRTVP